MSSDVTDVIGNLATAGAFIVSVAALVTSMNRAKQGVTEENIRALQSQMRALEMDVARNYMPRDQVHAAITDLGARLERAVGELSRQVENLGRDLTHFMRRESGEAG